MKQPPCYVDPLLPNYVCKLMVSNKFPGPGFSVTSKLHELGFSGSKADTSLFFFK